MTTQELYIQLTEGKINREKFLYEVRRDNNLPWVTNLTSFDDAVRILKNKSIIFESKIEQEETPKQMLTEARTKKEESKDADHVIWDQFQRGIRYELEQQGDYDLEKAQKKALTNLNKDPLYYLRLVSGQKLEKKRSDTMEYVDKKKSNMVDKRNQMDVAKKNEKANVQDTLGKKEKGTKKPKDTKSIQDDTHKDMTVLKKDTKSNVQDGGNREKGTKKPKGVKEMSLSTPAKSVHFPYQKFRLKESNEKKINEVLPLGINREAGHEIMELVKKVESKDWDAVVDTFYYLREKPDVFYMTEDEAISVLRQKASPAEIKQVYDLLAFKLSANNPLGDIDSDLDEAYVDPQGNLSMEDTPNDILDAIKEMFFFNDAEAKTFYNNNKTTFEDAIDMDLAPKAAVEVVAFFNTQLNEDELEEKLFKSTKGGEIVSSTPGDALSKDPEFKSKFKPYQG